MDSEPKHICHECGKPILDGELCLTLKEQETGRLVYIAHRSCAVDGQALRKLVVE